MFQLLYTLLDSILNLFMLHMLCKYALYYCLVTSSMYVIVSICICMIRSGIERERESVCVCEYKTRYSMCVCGCVYTCGPLIKTSVNKASLLLYQEIQMCVVRRRGGSYLQTLRKKSKERSDLYSKLCPLLCGRMYHQYKC